MENQIREFTKRGNRRRLFKRVVSLLCVVVLLFTMNTLKRNANTLERIAMCGLQEHTHTAGCYNSSGELVCAIPEHVHTDACYQQSPSDDLVLNGDDLEIADGLVDAGDTQSLDLSLDLDQGDLLDFVQDSDAPASNVQDIGNDMPVLDGDLVFDTSYNNEETQQLAANTSVEEAQGAVDETQSEEAQQLLEEEQIAVEDGQDQPTGEGQEQITFEEDQEQPVEQPTEAAQEQPVEEETEQPVEEEQEQPVEEETEQPVEEEQEQPVEEETEQPVEGEQLVEEDQDQIAIEEQPVVAEQEQPVEEVQEQLVIEEQEEPVVEAQEEPVVEEQEEPVVEEQEEPVIEEQEEPVVEEQEEPVVEEQEEPVAEEQEEPVVEEQEEPVVEEQEEPVVEEQEEPVVEEQEEPAVEEQEEPVVEEQEEPVVEEQEEPVAEEQEEPVVEEQEEPVAEEQEEPVVEEQEEPVVEEQEEPVVEEQEEPAVEEQEEPAIEEQEEPVVEEQEEPAIEEAEQPAEEEAEQPAEEEAEQPAEEEAEQPAEEEAEQPTEEEAEQPAEEEAEQPAEEEAEQPTEEEAEQPAEENAEQPAEEEAEQPTEEEAEQPTEEEAEQPAEEEQEQPAEVESDPEAEGESEEEPEARIAYPAKQFRQGTAYINVSVDAPEGAFPEGTVMVVRDVEDQGTIDNIQQSVTEDFVEVTSVHAVDISFWYNDAEIEPLLPIAVVMSAVEAPNADQAQETVVVHVDDNGETQLVDSAATGAAEASLEMPAAADAEAQAFEADTFSVYALVTKQVIETKYIDDHGDTWRIKVDYGKDAKLPEGASLQVSEVTSESYLAEAEAALESGKRITKARFFDIKIMDGDREVQPDDQVKVTVTLEGDEGEIEATENQNDIGNPDVVAMHFVEQDDETVSVEKQSAVETDEGVVFHADGFSTWGVIYTVDFEYNGQTYSILGMDEILLSKLIKELNMPLDIQNVKDVVFSNPDLVEVEELREDWNLISKKAFATDETLTLYMRNGSVIVIDVKDAQYTSDLNSLLTGVSVTVNGNPVSDGDTVEIDKNSTAQLKLTIQENDYLQFYDDSTEMVYHLPDGLNFGEAATSYITVDMGIDGKVYRNPLVYDPETNTITLKWNTKDPNFPKLAATDNAKVDITLNATFKENVQHVEFKTGFSIVVNPKEYHDARVNKSHQFFAKGENGNPYDCPAVKYTVVVTSNGTTTIDLQDVVQGTAITLDTDSSKISAVSNKGTTITPTFTNKGFTLNGQSLQDGEQVTITYWGKVDTSKIDNLSNATVTETGNTVTLTGDDEPDGNTATDYVHQIQANDLTKSSTGVGPIDANGKQVVHWQIVVNQALIDNLSGTTITDSIAHDSRWLMDYYATGIHVVATNADGQERINSDYTWASGNPLLDTDNEKWVFTVPATNEPLKYVITYDTIVDTAVYYATNAYGGYFSVVNNSEGKPGTGSGSATVGHPQGDTPAQEINYTKKAVDVNQETITWNVSINIDQKAGGYSEYTITETMPQNTFGNIGYIDELESIEVLGLNAGEWYSITPVYGYKDANGNPTSDAYGATGDYLKPSSYILTFYKDGCVGDDVQNKNGGNSTTNPGLSADSSRTMTVRVVTRNSDRWLKLAAEEGIAKQTYLQHTNTVKVNNLTPASDTASPMAKTIYKMRDGVISVTGPGSATVYKEVDVATDSDTIVNFDKTGYPAYKFWVLVGGVTKDNLKDTPSGKQLVIEDEFDPLFRLILNNEDSKEPKLGGATSPTSFNAISVDPSKGESFTWTQSEGKAVFTITNPPKNGDNYYPYYQVEYWLVPTSEEAYQTIKQLTLEAGGEKVFKNKAATDGAETELGFKYTYNVIEKSVQQETTSAGITLEKYKIEINKDKLTLNGGNSMTLTDTYTSNLSVDFAKAEVTAINRAGVDISDQVTWDYSGNVGTFKIPDEAYVVITYTGRVVGEAGSLQVVSNTAYMEGYSDTVTNERIVDLSGSATADRVRVRLMKYAADQMGKGLNGARFRLLDQDKKPVLDKDGNQIFFTTGIGYINKLGVLHAAGDALDYTYDESSGKYNVEGFYRQQLNAEGQARWEAGDIENPTDDPDKIVTYGDLSSASYSALGISLRSGFAEIALNQSTQGIALKRERVYYLEEIETPVDGSGQHYQKDFVKYSFLITDQANYTAPGGVYVYHNNDIVTVRNWPADEATLKIAKTFTGNAELTDEQKTQVTFTVQKKNGTEWVDYPIDVWNTSTNQREAKATFTYGDYAADKTEDENVYVKGDLLFKNGVLTIDKIQAGKYRVIESNAALKDETGTAYTRKTEYLVDGTEVTVTDDTQGVTVSVSEDDVTNKVSHDVSITNSYFTNKYEITKVSAETAQVLGNAKFSVYNANGPVAVKENLATDSNGKLSITKTGDYDYNILYYIVETQAPDGYITPEVSEREKLYFYFSDPADTPAWKPAAEVTKNDGGLPNGETAVDLTTGYGSTTIPNRRDSSRKSVTVNKKWVDSNGKDVTSTMQATDEVTMNLYRTTDKLAVGQVIDDGDVENAKNASAIKTLSYGSQKLYFAEGDRIQITVAAANNAKISFNSNPYIVFKDIIGTNNTEVTNRSVSFVAPNQDATITVTVDPAETAIAVKMVNLDDADRVYRLTHAEANSITKAEGDSGPWTRELTLNPENGWRQTVDALPVSDPSGNLYTYFVVEEDGSNTGASYDVGGNAVTVTNTAPDKLEVIKRWYDANGERIDDKKDGSIDFDLWQVENEGAVGPWSNTPGGYSVNTDGLKGDNYGNLWNVSPSGHLTNIKAGSKVEIRIKLTQNYVRDLEGSISITGCESFTDTGGRLITNDYIDQYGNQHHDFMYYERVIVATNVMGNLVISGSFNDASSDNTTVIVTVLEEPTNASQDFDDKQKNKLGSVHVTYDTATLTLAPAFASTYSKLYAVPGTKAYSSLIANLPTSGTGVAGGASAGKNVTYTYYVEETQVAGFKTPVYEYPDNGNAAAPGETIVIKNEKDAPKTGNLSVTKTVSNNGDTTKDFEFTVTLSGTSAAGTTGNAVNGTFGDMSFENGEATFTLKHNQTKTAANLPAGLTYTVVETQAGGYTTTYSGNTNTGSIPAGETASKTVTNTYSATNTVDFKAKKVFTNGNLGEHLFTFKLTQVTGNNQTTPATSNDVGTGEGKIPALKLNAAQTKNTTATTDTVTFDTITFTKNSTTDETGDYWFLLEEDVPEGVTAENPIKDGIKYDTTQKWIKVTVTDAGNGTLTVTKDPDVTNGVDGTWTNEQLGSLKLKKVLQENGEPLTSGGKDVYFLLQRVDNNGTPVGDPMYIKLWITNGNILDDYRLMTAEAYANGGSSYSPAKDGIWENGVYKNHANGAEYAILPDLAPGDYLLTELNQGNDVVTTIVRGDNATEGIVDNTARSVKVHIEAGSTVPATAMVTYTNNKVTKGSLEISKAFVPGSETAGANQEFTFKIMLKADGSDDFTGFVIITDKNRTAMRVKIDQSYECLLSEEELDDTEKYDNLDNWNYPLFVTVRGDGKATISDLPAGTHYEITEEGVEGWHLSGIVSDDALDADDNDSNKGSGVIAANETDHVTVTNNKVTVGALKLKKLVVDENGDAISDKRANGKYTFKIVGPAPSDEVAATVTIVVENGKATKYNLTGERDNYGDLVFVSLPDDGYVTIPDLATGTYTVTETECYMTTWKHKYEAASFQVRVNDNSAQLTGGDSVTVTVIADDPTTTDVVESTTVDFTNKVTLIPGALTVQKIWQDENGNPTQGNAAWEGVEKVYVSVTRVKNPNGSGSHEETVLSIDGKTELEITSQGKHYTLTQVGDDPDSNEYTASAEDTDIPWSIELENLNLCGSDEYYDGYIVKEIRVVRTDDSTEVPYVGFITTYSPTKDGEISRATIANPRASVNHEATITNKKVTTATLRLKKKLIADSSEPVNSDSSKTNGTYTFTVVGPTGADTSTRKYVIITTVDGVATSYKMGDMDSSWTEADIPTWDAATVTEQPVGTDEYVTLEGLVPGKYTVKEVNWKLDTTNDEFLKKAAMTLFDILVPAHEGNTVDISTRTATVWVGQGEAQTVDMTYENKLIPIEPTVKKMVIDINDSTETQKLNYFTEHTFNDSADYDIGDDVPYRITTNLPSEYYRSADTTKYFYELHDEMTHLKLKEWKMYAFVKTSEAVNGETGKWYDVTDSFMVDAGAYQDGKQMIKVHPKNTDYDLLQVTSNKWVSNWGDDNTHVYHYPYRAPDITEESEPFGGYTSREIRYLQFRYTATLMDDATIGSEGNPNVTWLMYENGTTDHGKSKEDKNKVFTYRLAFNKVDDQNRKLNGATFELFKKYLPANRKNGGNIEEYFENRTDLPVGEYVDGNETAYILAGPTDALPKSINRIESSAVSADANVYVRVMRTSNENYDFIWNGIDDGEYLLIETAAPTGYKPLASPIAITISAGHQPDADDPQMTSFSFTAKENGATIDWFTVNKTETTVEGGNRVTVNPDSVTGAIPNTPYSGGVRIKKIDWNTKNATNPTTLQGAEFTIRKWDESQDPDQYMRYITGGKTTAVETTDAQGIATFDKLEAGEYMIEETKVPNGYAKPDNDIYIKVEYDAEGNFTIKWYDKGAGEEGRQEINSATYVACTPANGTEPITFTVGNLPGVSLPATGGMGTGVVYGAGAALMLLAVLGMILTKRKRTDGEGIR